MQLTAGVRLRAGCFAFDMDGTLLNSEPAIQSAWRDWAVKNGLPAQEVVATAAGRRSFDVIKSFAPRADMAAEAAFFDEAIAARVNEIQEVPGARAFLRTLPVGSWGIVTSANRQLALTCLAALQFPLPQVLIAASDVQEGKPSPMGYLMAAKLIGSRPENMIVFEDSHSGIEAAERSGAGLVVVTSSLEPGQIEPRSWIRDYRGLTYTSGFVQFG